MARLDAALADTHIVGLHSNVAFLRRVVRSASFSNADLDTALIEREDAFLFAVASEPPREAWLAAALAELLRERTLAAQAAGPGGDPHSPWHSRDGWRLNSVARRALVFRSGPIEKTIQVAYAGREFVLELDGQPTRASGQLLPGGELRADLGGSRSNITAVVAAEKRHVFLHGRCHVFAAVDPLSQSLDAGGSEGSLTAPMPGKVIALVAQPGERITKGAPLLILEAMKMEHTIAAPSDGTVKSFRYAVGEQVSDGAELVEFEAT